jgi:hypothetical protein
MAFGGSGRNLKSEFQVAPGADPSQIRLRYTGTEELRIEGGALVIPAGGRELREQAPSAYQERAGRRIQIESRFALSAGTVGFVLGDYDPKLPLVIDPVLCYSTLLGGSGADAGTAVAVDSAGAVYVAGYTDSYDFPTSNAEQGYSGGSTDAFVVKLNPSGGLAYATYLGGSGDDRAYAIAVDGTGAVYIAGSTESQNFPTKNPYQSKLAGGRDAFVAKLSPAGNTLVYSTYLGGAGTDVAYGIAADASGYAYVAGDTNSSNFPANGMQRNLGGGQDAFVAKMAVNGAQLVYSTYLGGGNDDHGAAIAVDSAGTVYLAGSTWSIDFPVANAFQSKLAGGEDAFVARLSADGNTLLFSTYLGGSGGTMSYPETSQAIALDGQGNAYVAGTTSSVDFPILNPAQGSLRGFLDAFVSKFSSAGALVYSTYLGGSSVDYGNAIAVDTSGSAYVAGYTYSTDLPVVGALQENNAGECDGFIAQLGATGSTVTYLTYWGGSAADSISALALDANGGLYATGLTLSSNFPLLAAYQMVNVGNYGAFVTKQSFAPLSDVAERKLAAQSSGYNSASGAALAVDGNTDGTFADGSVTATNLETNPWWGVDLGTSVTINSIVIWNRTDCCQDRLADYWVFVSDTPFGPTDTPSTLEGRAGTWSSHQTTWPNPSVTMAVGAEGRYVRVQLTGTNYLSLAEVQVMGIPIASSGSNLALGKLATQSSSYSTVSGAALAIDGNTDGTFADGSVTATNLETSAWWGVDLGTSVTINSIVIWNRTDCCQDRLADYWVFVSDTPFGPTDTPSTLEGRAGTWSSHQTTWPNPSVTMAVGAEGRYVRVQLTGTNYLSLAEVQIF